MRQSVWKLYEKNFKISSTEVRIIQLQKIPLNNIFPFSFFPRLTHYVMSFPIIILLYSVSGGSLFLGELPNSFTVSLPRNFYILYHQCCSGHHRQWFYNLSVVQVSGIRKLHIPTKGSRKLKLYLAIYDIFRYRALRNATNILLINLCAAGLVMLSPLPLFYTNLVHGGPFLDIIGAKVIFLFFNCITLQYLFFYRSFYLCDPLRPIARW